MSGRFAPYPSYEQSAADWHDEVPTGWKTLAIGRLFRRDKRTGFEEEELLSVYRDHGVIPKSSRDDNHNNSSEDLSPYQLVDIGDLVLNKMKAWQGSIAVSEYRGIVSPAYFVYRRFREDESRIILRYIHYLLRSSAYITQYLRQSKGIRVSQWDLDPKAFERIEALLPKPEEQTRIAAFLDHETAKIDALIARQQELIALLKEKRQAVISHAVTRGLNPDVKLRDSGVEWLGQVPEHWEVKRLKHISPKIGVGLVINPSTYTREEGRYFIFGGNVREYEFELKGARRISPADSDRLTPSRLNTNDLVSVRVGEPGLTAVVTKDLDGANCASLVIVRRGDFDSRWLCATLNSWIGRRQVDVAAYGAAQKQYNISDAVEFVCPVPPRDEQSEIAVFVDSTLSRFQKLISSAKASVALLQERRSALISAAVTGKIDVRNWEPPAAGVAS